MSYDIRIDDLRGPEVLALLREHLEFVHVHSPPESIHALGVEALKAPEITFWSVWEGDSLAGCGALKELDGSHCELKSMRTVEAFRRKGVASALLRFLLEEARRRGYRRASLETGSMAGFAPARALYARFGFEECGPFADYELDPNSVFMTLALAP
ncbi:MAG: GNAT family N-acetyltransferase [Acidobacteria bacterium]|nr:GNAT family N-acetyltransferase [Acidobacteriota bacterium]